MQCIAFQRTLVNSYEASVLNSFDLGRYSICCCFGIYTYYRNTHLNLLEFYAINK